MMEWNEIQEKKKKQIHMTNKYLNENCAHAMLVILDRS